MRRSSGAVCSSQGEWLGGLEVESRGRGIIKDYDLQWQQLCINATRGINVLIWSLMGF